jgi:hypothetical protein
MATLWNQPMLEPCLLVAAEQLDAKLAVGLSFNDFWGLAGGPESDLG